MDTGHGKSRTFRAGFAELALSSGAPVVPISARWEDDGDRVRLLVFPPLDPGGPDASHAERTRSLVELYTRFYDEQCRLYPYSVKLGRMRTLLRNETRLRAGQG